MHRFNIPTIRRDKISKTFVYFVLGLQPPGRLRHSLNINVGALLPGTGPPKVRPVSAVFEQKNDEIEKAPSSEIKVNKEEESSSGILHSITKVSYLM